MRLDQFLKKTCLLKQRAAAKALCDRQYVKVNGQNTKPSKHINIGDIIEIETAEGIAQYRILKIPSSNVSKSERVLYYQETAGAGDEQTKPC